MVIGIDASRANQREKTGTEWHTWHLLHHLAPLLQGHEVRLYVREPLTSDLQGLGGHMHARVLRWPPGLLWSHLRLSWELWRHPPDVLFIPSDTVPVFHPRRSFTIIHDVAFERFPELYRGKSVQRRLGWLRPFVHAAVRIFTLGRYSASERDYHRWSARHAARTCPIIFTVSEFSKQEIVETLHVAPERIVVTYPGVPQADQFTAITADEEAVTLRGLHLERPYFFYVGRLEKKKNMGNVLLAFERYRSVSADPLDLVLAGSPGFGWQEAWQGITAATQTHVHVLSWQPTPVIRILEKRARAMVFLSRHEGFGVPPCESFSAGVPVMATALGSLPEVLGPAGFFVDADNLDEIAHGFDRIATDTSLRAALIAAGKQQAQRYTWEQCAALTAEYLLGKRALPGVKKNGIV